MNKSARPHTRKSRQLLDIAVEARSEYADYLRAVADRKCSPDKEKKDYLKRRCEKTLRDWQEVNRAWLNTDWITAGRYRNS